jgi:hypothetical protein
MVRRTILFLTVSLLLLSSEGWGREWNAFQATRSGDIYYFDPESLEKPGEGVVRVWVKIERTAFEGGDFKKNVEEVVAGKKDKVTGEILQLVDIRCSEKTFRVINLIVFDQNKEIKEYYSDPSEWNAISSESVMNFLSREVCQ